MTPGEAIQFLVEQIIPIANERGEWPEIGQIDFAATEDGSASVHVHFDDDEINGGLPVAASFDLAEVFREEFDIALFAAGVMHGRLTGAG